MVNKAPEYVSIDQLLDLKPGDTVTLHCQTSSSASIFLRQTCPATGRTPHTPDAALLSPINYSQHGIFGAIRHQGNTPCVVLTGNNYGSVVETKHGTSKLLRETRLRECETLVPIRAIKRVVV